MSILKSLINLSIITLSVLLLSTSCARKVYHTPAETNITLKNKRDINSASPTRNKTKTEEVLILEAEKLASKEGKAILETGRKMALEEKVIIKGSCWNWVNECFKRAGYETEKYVAFDSKKSGPFVDILEIKPGDWVYYINHSYNDIEHSGIFVYWIDFQKKTAMILSYGGESRNAPGRYLPYELSNVYYIIRAGKKP